ncbi:uncharacterized protein LOC122395884 [Colletes gigas]|uniref:uncharacterized protein LOC122395884 n=1 Tax=Colletes gigas TaxID=935657 RepID=UPI001C9B9B88|nr:uncharacterized protein LOC122395884 [Colletes gigas]
MKLPQLFALGCCSIIVVLSESTESGQQELLARASAQLERLAPYRRSSSSVQGSSDEQWQFLEGAAKDPGTVLEDRQMAFEIYQILPENLQKDIARRMGGDQAVVELLANPKYMALLQERRKRSGNKGSYGVKRDGYGYEGYERLPDEGQPPEEYGGYGPEEHPGGGEYPPYGGYPQSSGSDSGGIIKGSGSLIGGIAKGIIGGIVSASGSASKGSSSISASSASDASSSSSSTSSGNQNKPEYGQVYSYGDKAFDVWDFKKAIVSTLMQAVKAISGGVIALKGQLIKGSGYLVSSKGKMIATTGDAITSLGRNIAKNAAYPPQPPHPGYGYGPPPEGGHHESYDGPPPGVEDYNEPSNEYHGNTNYESSSDVDEHAGLLIVKQTKPNDHDDHSTDLDSQKPALTHLEDNYNGPPPGLDDKHVKHTLVGNIDIYEKPNNGNDVTETHHHLHDRPPSSYDVPTHHHAVDDHKAIHDYPIYPPLASGLPLSLHGPLTIQQSLEYPPIHIQYKFPGKGSFKLPHADNSMDVYSSFSIDVEPDMNAFKLSTGNHGPGHELPKLPPHPNFHGFPPNPFPGAPVQGPLKIPLLSPYLPPHWPSQGLLQPIAGFDAHGVYRRRNTAHRRRSVNDVAQRMRRHRV